MTIGLLSFALLARGQTTAQTQRADKGKTLHVTSRDGTRIAYEKWGKGPALIVVNGALSDRSSNAGLAQLLAAQLTLYSYDRRGRGDSSDTQPYSVQRVRDCTNVTASTLRAEKRSAPELWSSNDDPGEVYEYSSLSPAAENFAAPEPLDLIWTSENYHDLYNERFGAPNLRVVNRAC